MFKRVRHKAVLLAPAVLIAVWGLPGMARAQEDVAARGEIVVRFPTSYTNDQINAAVADAGCTIKKAIPFADHYYVLIAPTTTRKVTRDTQTPLPPGVTPEVAAAVTKLTATSGVIANPNWRIKPRDWQPPKQTPKIPFVVPTKPAQSRTTRQTSTTAQLIPNDPLYNLQEWHMSAIRMPEAWAIQYSTVKRTVIVAVSDTGVNSSHPDFKLADGSNLFVSPIDTTKNPTITDVTDEDADAAHGTHVTGIIGAITNNGIGTTGVAGLHTNNIDVRIMPIKIFASTTNVGFNDAAIAAVLYAAKMNADVHNMSWGTADEINPTPNPTLEAAVAEAATTGIVMVNAAGNANSTVEDNWPGNYPGVIRVTAVGTNLTKTAYSSYGPHVAIAAPGGNGEDAADGPTDVWSLSSSISVRAVQADGSNYYEGISGTSQASPHVAGAAALLVAMGVPRTQVRAALQAGARPLDETPVYDYNSFSKYGAGLLDVYASILPYTDPPFSVSFVTGSSIGQSYTAQQPALTLQAYGVTKAPSVGQITIEVQTATYPSSVVRKLVEGTDFTLPRSVATGQPTGATVTFLAPATGTITLPPGRYNFVLKNGDTVLGTVFTEVLARTQPQGQRLFASPFRTPVVNDAQPEQTLLGLDASIGLARPLEEYSGITDYAIFSTKQGVGQDMRASFKATLKSGAPAVFDVTNRSTSVAPVGLGYWLNLDRSVTINPVGPTVSNPVGVQLTYSADTGTTGTARRGWNLIGAPFTTAAAWGSCSVEVNGNLLSLGDAITAGYIDSAIIGYDGTDYTYAVFPLGTLDPFNGYWVHVNVPCTLIIPPAGSTRSIKDLTPTVKNIAAVTAPVRATNLPGQSGLPKVDGWRGRLIAYVAGDRDGQNYFGQSRAVTSGSVNQDIPKPPSGSGHAYVRFEKKATGKSVSNLAFDMRPVDAKEEWTALVSTDKSASDVTLTWDSLMGLPRNTRLTLMDTVTGKTVDMKSRSSYTYRSGEAGATRRITITSSAGASRGMLAITGVMVTSGGRSVAGSGYTVRYQTTDDADVVATVKSLGGKDVASFTGATRAVGGVANTLHWNGRMKDGTPVAPGAYIVVIEARGTNGEKAIYTQPIQSLQ